MKLPIQALFQTYFDPIFAEYNNWLFMFRTYHTRTDITNSNEALNIGFFLQRKVATSLDSEVNFFF